MVKALSNMLWQALFWLIIGVLATVPAMAEADDCEKLAKDYQRANGGDLIFIQPLKDNGAYDLGEYNGHWMNRAWNKNDGNYYYDVQGKAYYFSIRAIELDFEERWNKDVVVLNYNQGEVQFGIVWYY